MKPWKDMSPEEKGALLLAHHEGKVIEARDPYNKADTWEKVILPNWTSSFAYRVKPVVKEVLLEGFVDHERWYNGRKSPGVNYKITFNLVDGEPDCSSIKMEKLK